MTELAEFAMFIRLHWPLFTSLGLIVFLALVVIPAEIKSEADLDQKIWEDKYTLGNIQHTLEKAKSLSTKKYGGQ